MMTLETVINCIDSDGEITLEINPVTASGNTGETAPLQQEYYNHVVAQIYPLGTGLAPRTW